MIRRAEDSDIDFLIAVARARYGAVAKFDESRARAWLHKVLREPRACVLRGDYGGAVGVIQELFWGGEPRAHMLFTATLPNRCWEGYRLIKALDEWRRAEGADRLYFGSETGVDFSAFARRIGAMPETQSYVIMGGHVPRSPAKPLPRSAVLDYALARFM